VKTSGSKSHASRQDIIIRELQVGQKGIGLPKEAIKSTVFALD
jgi:hypothetical protein